jgi:hypothetical protein
MIYFITFFLPSHTTTIESQEEKELNARVAHIQDPELREQAYRLGKEILLKNTPQ